MVDDHWKLPVQMEPEVNPLQDGVPLLLVEITMITIYPNYPDTSKPLPKKRQPANFSAWWHIASSQDKPHPLFHNRGRERDRQILLQPFDPFWKGWNPVLLRTIPVSWRKRRLKNPRGPKFPPGFPRGCPIRRVTNSTLPRQMTNKRGVNSLNCHRSKESLTFSCFSSWPNVTCNWYGTNASTRFYTFWTRKIFAMSKRERERKREQNQTILNIDMIQHDLIYRLHFELSTATIEPNQHKLAICHQ